MLFENKTENYVIVIDKLPHFLSYNPDNRTIYGLPNSSSIIELAFTVSDKVQAWTNFKITVNYP